MKDPRFLKSAALLSLSGVLAKGIGALYRIPLSNLLGSYGMGLYQMAYPLFCMLLTFSSAGIPSAFSRIVAREHARGQGTKETLKTALRLFAVLGLSGTALMCLFAPHMSNLQGESALLPCYLSLAPSVFLIALIAVLRGYFQGKDDMKPTAVSEIVEQLVKAGFGLFFALRFATDPKKAVSYCLFAVTLSEAAALFYLLLKRRPEYGRMLLVRKTTGRDILFAALPVMASAALLPLSQTVDSVLLVRLMGGHTTRAVALYGLYTGGAMTLVNLPATACYGLAASSVPVLSGCFTKGKREEGRERALYALMLTLLLSLPCAVGLFLFARPIAAILYPGLDIAEKEIFISLLRLSSVSAVSLAGVNTLAACLTGMGKAKKAAFSMLLAVLAKFLLQTLLVANPEISVFGAAIAANCCYLIAFFLDLFYTVKKDRVENYDYGDRIGRDRGRLAPAGAENFEKRRLRAGQE